MRRELEALFQRHRLGLPENRVECTSPLTLRTLLLETEAIAALPFLIAHADPQIQILPTALEQVTRTVGVTLPAEQPPSPVTALLLRQLCTTASVIRNTLGNPLKSGPDGP